MRAWDGAGEVSARSAPASFETGLLKQSDWGSAKWIELAGRTNAQPLPIFARAFSVDKTVKSARLYMSGLGLSEAQVNGSKLTDEVLAPGYTNYQLSAECRTYDVTSKLRGGANTIGVELGTAPASTTLALPAAAGDTSVKLSSVTGMAVGGKLNIGSQTATIHPGRNRRGQHHAGRRLGRGRGAAPAAGAAGRELDLERHRALDDHARRHDPHAQDVHGGQPGEHRPRPAADQRRRLARHVRQRPAGRAVGRRQRRLADLADRRRQAAPGGGHERSSKTLVTNRDWRAAFGPMVTDRWFGGTDYDARREQADGRNREPISRIRRSAGTARTQAGAARASPRRRTWRPSSRPATRSP